MARSIISAGLALLCCSLLIHYTFANIHSNTLKTKLGENKINNHNKTLRDVEHKPTFMDSPLMDMSWCGNNDQALLALTEKGTLYRTNDFGKTWTNLQNNTGTRGEEEESAPTVNISVVSKMLKSPVDSSVFIFLGVDGVNWITEDCGLTIRAMKIDRKLMEIQFHPYERSWILASALTTCDGIAGKSCKINQELYFTKDLGESWTLLADYVIQFAWGIPDKPFFVKYVPSQRIVIAHQLDKRGNQQFRGLPDHTEITYSDDFFKTTTTILKQSKQFLISKNHFLAIQANNQKIQLFTGPSDVQTYTLQPVILPVEGVTEGKVLEYSSSILDAASEQVYLQIHPEGDHAKYGDIYTSDTSGRLYSLSLENNVRSQNGQSDFQKVEGLEGIVLANVYDSQIINSIQIGATIRGLDEYKKTMITFNKGSVWQPLKAPIFNAKGGLIRCESQDSCHLHLHSFSSVKQQPPQSTSNALGILLGVGNVGKYLSNQESEINTYLSRDAGRTWFEVLQGSYIFEIGDHGAIIVAAPDQKATTHVLYTWDQGLTWEWVQVSETPILISKILVEPSSIGLHFVIHGRVPVSSQGVVIPINFGSLNQRICQLPGKPDSGETDYEKWNPHGLTSCFMGQRTTYIRRKREAQCVNPEGLEQVYSNQICECTEHDWQCDFGFERSDNGICERKAGNFPSVNPSEECSGEFYFVSQGYRKIPGNQCIGGVNHAPIPVRCPGKQIPVFTILALLYVVALIAVLVLFSKKSHVIQFIQFINNINMRLASLRFYGKRVIPFEMREEQVDRTTMECSTISTSMQDVSNPSENPHDTNDEIPQSNNNQYEIITSVKDKKVEVTSKENDNSMISMN